MTGILKYPFYLLYISFYIHLVPLKKRPHHTDEVLMRIQVLFVSTVTLNIYRLSTLDLVVDRLTSRSSIFS